MKNRNKKKRKGIVYSTDPNFKYDYGEPVEVEPVPAAEQRITIVLDAKGRHGKVATLVKGFVGTSDDLRLLGKAIKTQCGTGGSVKDDMIIIQGDMRERISEILGKRGYNYSIR